MNQVLLRNTMIMFLVALPMETSERRLDAEEGGAMGPSPNPSVMGLFPKTHIYIHNLLGDGLTVTYHAKSQYWDFGLCLLQSGQVDELVFHPFLISPLSDIRCEWSKQGAAAITMLYRYSRDFGRCYKHCHWKVTPQGIYGVDKNGFSDIYYKWESL